jgi:hypothetical protein
MTLETCACGNRFAVGFLRCGRCGAVAPSFAGRVLEVPARVSARPMPVLDGSFKELRVAAKARGLSAAGTAAELKARIAEHDATKAGEVP